MIINDSENTWVIQVKGGLSVTLQPNQAYCCVTEKVLTIEKPST